MPADMACGSAAEIEEERRLLYVAMTRARDALSLWVPQRFHVTQQRTLGGRHLYALRSRFIPQALLPHFEAVQPAAPGEPTARLDPEGSAPLMDLRAALRGEWVATAPPVPGIAAQPDAGDPGQNPQHTR
jgi:DNA helicase-2/ATP-dependent DNA helicase PcrA